MPKNQTIFQCFAHIYIIQNKLYLFNCFLLQIGYYISFHILKRLILCTMDIVSYTEFMTCSKLLL